MNTVQQILLKRAVILVLAAVVIVNMLIGLQSPLEQALGEVGYYALGLVLLGLVTFAAYNNCKTALRQQGLPKNYTDTHR